MFSPPRGTGTTSSLLRLLDIQLHANPLPPLDASALITLIAFHNPSPHNFLFLRSTRVLDEQEFENAMRNSGIPFSEPQILMLMAAADMNADGGIQYGEFAEVAVQLMSYVAREETIQAEMDNVPVDDE